MKDPMARELNEIRHRLEQPSSASKPHMFYLVWTISIEGQSPSNMPNG